MINDLERTYLIAKPLKEFPAWGFHTTYQAAREMARAWVYKNELPEQGGFIHQRSIFRHDMGVYWLLYDQKYAEIADAWRADHGFSRDTPANGADNPAKKKTGLLIIGT